MADVPQNSPEELIDYELEKNRSHDFFMDPASYGRFYLDRDLRRVVGCIDPRDQEGDELHTVVQTAGAAAGEGADTAIAMAVAEGRPFSVEEGIALEANQRRASKLAAHKRCKYIESMADIFGEMAEPSAQTEAAFDRWAHFYELQEVVSSVLPELQGRAAEMRLSPSDPEALVEFIDKLYPSQNIAEMRGENRARIYVVNHHPHAGLKRNLKHREAGLKVQGYHDSLGAIISDRLMSRRTPEVLVPSLGAVILRAAAVRTKLGGAHDDTAYLEVQMTEHGPQISEVAA